MLYLEPLQHGQTEDEFSRVDAGRDSGRIVAKLTQNIGAYTQRQPLTALMGPQLLGVVAVSRLFRFGFAGR